MLNLYDMGLIGSVIAQIEVKLGLYQLNLVQVYSFKFKDGKTLETLRGRKLRLLDKITSNILKVNEVMENNTMPLSDTELYALKAIIHSMVRYERMLEEHIARADELLSIVRSMEQLHTVQREDDDDDIPF